ncbi:alpha/beta hydrolase [Terrarubrum flagellatum]|uniref:alpha/beta fold hydrolase n=1 Tax=Terrirubrum flagellatum TaxID=2895980 RepID=UPI0031454604
MEKLTQLKTPDGRFAYEAAGPERAPALVFLHGVGGAGRAFRSQLAAFGDRYRAVAWDMPGYGGSAPLAAVSIASFAAALKDFLAAIGAEKPLLIGHSIGGMIVQQLISDEPRLPRAIVLAQTSPAFGSSDGDWQKNFLEARLSPLDRGETLKSLAPGIVRSLVGDDADPAGMALAEDCMGSVPEATYRAAMQALMGFDLREALGRIAIPTLVLAGSKDTNAPAPMMQKMAARISGAKYIELAGVGHLAGLERPAEFNAAIASFIDAHS